MSDHSHPDCKNKDSVHYFMCDMTQEEFEGRIDRKSIPHYDLNMVRKENAQKEQKPIKANVNFRKDS